jgi:hypothetical protein
VRSPHAHRSADLAHLANTRTRTEREHRTPLPLPERCSIKDSFASLDLTGYGFWVLFDAQRIVHRVQQFRHAPDDASWEVVHDRVGLAACERAWRGNDGLPGVFRAGLLDLASVTVLAARRGDLVVAGAVLNRSSSVVGISNFFAPDPDGAASWSGCLALAGTPCRARPSSAMHPATRWLWRNPMASKPWVAYGCGFTKTETEVSDRYCSGPDILELGED